MAVDRGASIKFRAFSAKNLQPVSPGPMAQGGVPGRASRLGCETIAFRAFGAETQASPKLPQFIERSPQSIEAFR
jgi:hypothetical protein